MSSCLICDAHQQQSLENAWDQDNHLNHCTIDVPFSVPYCILKKPKDWVKNHLILLSKAIDNIGDLLEDRTNSQGTQHGGTQSIKELKKTLC